MNHSVFTSLGSNPTQDKSVGSFAKGHLFSPTSQNSLLQYTWKNLDLDIKHHYSTIFLWFHCWCVLIPITGYSGIPKRSGTLKDISGFDATYFGVHAKQADATDPQLRIMLEVTYEAIVDSGKFMFYYCLF